MDIDIDVSDRKRILELVKHRKALLKNGKVHNTGVYFCEIPHDPITGISTIPYDEADERGYFKFDILNVNIYSNIRDNDHLDELINKEPMWELLQHKEFVDNLFHLSGHDQLLKKTKPVSLKQLAAVLCMIRPAKKYLENRSWNEIYEQVWTIPENGEYFFKKAHSFSYAMAVIVHMNLLVEQYSNTNESINS